MPSYRYAAIALAIVSVTAMACAAPAPPAPTAPPTSTSKSSPTAAPAAKPAQQPTGATTDKPAAASQKPVTPAVNRVVMSLPPPQTESNDVRNLLQTNTWQIKPIYEYLLGVDAATGKLIPQLASEWSVENGGLDLRFKLRRGAQFHKGNGEFTAKDVVFSWQDMTRDDTIHGLAPYFREIVKDIEVVNDYEVVYHMSRVDGNFLRAISEAEQGMEMRSKADYDKRGSPTLDTEPLAGTAPYQYRERQQGAFVRFDRVAQHWRELPDFPEFEFRFQREAATRMAALLANEAHIAVVPEDQISDATSRGFSLVRGTQAGLRTFLQMQC